MKCSEVKNFFQPLLDSEIESKDKREIKKHLDVCDLCCADFECLQTTRTLLQKQPPVLPSMSFDSRVLQAFENRQNAKQKSEKGWFAGFFAVPKPALAFAIGVFLVALGLTFLLGRMSVALPPQILAEKPDAFEPQKDEIKLPIVSPVKDETAASPVIKTMVKYVEVPIVKEKIVERIVYLNKPKRKNKIEDMPVKNSLPTIAKSDNPASQFNLKDLQPVADATYKIIRKGENNNE